MSVRTETARLAEIAAAIGDPARAIMLTALMAGRALTAGELAFHAGIAAPTASGHLAKLHGIGLLAQERQGRHRYYRLASPDIAHLLEGMTAVVATVAPPRRRGQARADEALATARLCYDHLAGRLGVAIADALVAREAIVWSEEAGRVTAAGERFLADLGIDRAAAGRRRRAFCRPCLDWTERRPHLAGSLGAALAACAFDRGWVLRRRDTRALAITPLGNVAFRELFGVEV